MRSLAIALLAAAACGNSGSGTPDAGDGDGDAMIDADPNVRGPVTVKLVNKAGLPLEGMHVVFIDTDETVTDSITDAAGVVTASVYPGASATAVRARDSGLAYALTTVQALVPNDTVTLITAAANVSSVEDPFTLRVVPVASSDVATATKSGSTATFTTVAPHGLAADDRVVVAGVSVGGYNGARTVASTPTATSFTASIGAGGLADATGGTAGKATAFTLTFPSYGGATSYEVHTSCGPIDVGTQTSVELVLRDACLRSPMDVLVFAKTSSTTEAAYTERTNVTITAGASVAITDTWHAVPSVTATYSNPTSRVTEVAVDRFTPYVRGTAPASAEGTTTGDPVVLTFNAATPASAWMRTSLRCPSGTSNDCISSGIGVAQQVISQQLDGTATTYALDVGANLLPWVNAVYTPLTTSIDVTVTGTGAIDLFEANLRYVRFVGNDQVIYTWRVFGPLAQSVTFPTLPSTLPGDPTVRVDDTQSAYQVYLCESDAIAGYRDAIKNVYEALGTCETASTPTTKPQGGTLNRLSQWN